MKTENVIALPKLAHFFAVSIDFFILDFVEEPKDKMITADGYKAAPMFTPFHFFRGSRLRIL